MQRQNFWPRRSCGDGRSTSAEMPLIKLVGRGPGNNESIKETVSDFVTFYIQSWKNGAREVMQKRYFTVLS